jgi:hypothetical protein
LASCSWIRPAAGCGRVTAPEPRQPQSRNATSALLDRFQLTTRTELPNVGQRPGSPTLMGTRLPPHSKWNTTWR